MVSILHRFKWIATLTTMVCLVCVANAQQTSNDSFVIKISLPKATIHFGDELEIGMIFSNPTDHVVTMGEGQNGGVDLEAMSEKGEDIGPYISGSANTNRIPRPNFAPNRQILKSGHKLTFVWVLKPDPKHLTPGTYKLRVHNRDVGTGSEVYSNPLTLTVLP